MERTMQSKIFPIFVIGLMVGFFAIYGWAENIIKLAHMSFDPITGMAILRAIGVVLAPLGVVLGYV